ncbi:hypothetical protein ACHAXT_002977 [Thalassiosira profunda]
MSGPSKQSGGGPQPAYDGARFDVKGHCLKHPHIRLCKPAKSSSGEDTKYVIVRKSCFLCGEHALCNERKLNRKARVHGYKERKPAARKATPRGLVGTDNGHPTPSKAKKAPGTKKAAPGSPSRAKEPPRSTPPVTPESNASREKELTVKLVDTVSSPPPIREARRTTLKLVDGGAAPPLPAREARRTTGRAERVRLQGTVPGQDGVLHAPRASKEEVAKTDRLTPGASRFHYQAGRTDRQNRGRAQRRLSLSDSDIAAPTRRGRSQPRSSHSASGNEGGRRRAKSQPRSFRSASVDEPVPRRSNRSKARGKAQTQQRGRGKDKGRLDKSIKSTTTASTASMSSDERSGGNSSKKTGRSSFVTVKTANGQRSKSVFEYPLEKPPTAPHKGRKLTFMERIEHGMRV